MNDAVAIVRALRGKWYARDRYGMACCPVHDDSRPSLSIKDGDKALLVHCFAGCDTRDVLSELRRRGLLDDGPNGSTLPKRPPTVEREHVPDARALELWRASKPAVGSIVETYLRGRGITILPPSLRYDPSTMVAGVQRPDGRIVAVQTTLLTVDGRKAPVPVPRITHGALGRGVVRFAAAGNVLGLAEGTETALTAMQLTGIPCWACLGASRMHRVAVPDRVRELYLFGDNDEPGRVAIERTAHEHRHRRVVLRFPPTDCKDWNDCLQAGRAAA